MLKHFNKNPLARATIIAMGLSCGTSAMALTTDDIEIHGFFTAGATISDTEKTYGRTTDNDVAFDEDTVLGVQIIVPIDDKLTLQAQFLANGSKETDVNFDTTVDWAFASYAATDNLTVRGGRIRAPLLMHMEYGEVGYAYPWIRPPQEVYSLIPFNSFDGFDALYSFPTMGGIDLVLQPFVGNKDDELLARQFGGAVIDTEIDNIHGLKVALSSEYVTFVVSYSNLDVTIEGGGPVPVPPAPVPGLTYADRLETEILNVGLTIDWNNFLFMSEYVDVDPDDPGALTEIPIPNNQAWYATVGYRFGKFMPHVTFAEMDSDDIALGGTTSETLTVGLRYELSPSAALKFEWANVEPQDGSIGLFTVSPIDPDVTDDADIFSVAIDVIF